VTDGRGDAAVLRRIDPPRQHLHQESRQRRPGFRNDCDEAELLEVGHPVNGVYGADWEMPAASPTARNVTAVGPPVSSRSVAAASMRSLVDNITRIRITSR